MKSARSRALFFLLNDRPYAPCPDLSHVCSFLFGADRTATRPYSAHCPYLDPLSSFPITNKALIRRSMTRSTSAVVLLLAAAALAGVSAQTTVSNQLYATTSSTGGYT